MLQQANRLASTLVLMGGAAADVVKRCHQHAYKVWPKCEPLMLSSAGCATIQCSASLAAELPLLGSPGQHTRATYPADVILNAGLIDTQTAASGQQPASFLLC